MKKTLHFVLLLLVPILSAAQDKNLIIQQATIVANATKTLDSPTIIKYTHASAIKLAGGTDAMLKFLTSTMGSMTEQGVQIDSVKLGQPGNFFKAGNEIHCLLPQELIMKYGSDKKIITKGYLLAISSDNGLKWTFLNLSEQLNNQTITKLLPNFNQEMVLPTDSKMEVVEQ
ncbi:MAG: hypothetical protein ACO1NU_13350 [Arcticibacter sp.]